MIIRIASVMQSDYYKDINEYYGIPLKKYGLLEKDNKSYIQINEMEDLFELYDDLQEYSKSRSWVFYGIDVGIDRESGERKLWIDNDPE